MNLKPNIVAECDALDLLERMESSCVDLVYLDPPWFSNNQKILDEFEEYKSFISKVLTQCVRVLKDTGNLFLYTRPDLTPDFSWMLRELLGTSNFVSEYVIPVRIFGASKQTTHETVLQYGRSQSSKFNSVYYNSGKDVAKLFPHKDEKGRYTYLSPFIKTTSGNIQRFVWKEIQPPEGMEWKYNSEQLDELNATGHIEVSDAVYIKKYYNLDEQLMRIGSIWNDIPIVFRKPGEQSVQLLERIIKTGSNRNDTVLDPFCGWGTSGEASINLGRQFILCDNSQQAINHTIARIGGLGTIKYYSINEVDLNRINIVWKDYVSTIPGPEDEIISLISAGESATVEFKVAAWWNEAKQRKDADMMDNILRTIAGFANTAGGTLLIGVNDDSMVVGLTRDFEMANRQKSNQDGYELFLNEKIKDKLGAEIITQCSIKFYEIAAKTICKIDVESSPIPIFLNGQFHCRNGNQTLKLDVYDFYKYMKSREYK